MALNEQQQIRQQFGLPAVSGGGPFAAGGTMLQQNPAGGWMPVGGPTTPFNRPGPMLPPVSGGAPADPMVAEETQQQKPRGFLPSVGQALKDYGPLALAGLSAWEGYRNQRKQDEMIRRAIGAEEKKEQMLAEGRERRRGLAANRGPAIIDQSNPYRRTVGG